MHSSSFMSARILSWCTILLTLISGNYAYAQDQFDESRYKIFQSFRKVLASGDLEGFKSLLRKHPEMATEKVVDSGYRSDGPNYLALSHYVVQGPQQHFFPGLSESNKIEALKALVAAGTDINEDVVVSTALMRGPRGVIHEVALNSRNAGSAEVMKYLLEKGADVNKGRHGGINCPSFCG